MTTTAPVTGREIAELRNKLGITRRELANEAGYTPSHINYLESRKYPDERAVAILLEAIDRIKNHYGIQPVEGQIVDHAKFSQEIRKQILYLYLFCDWSPAKISQSMGINYDTARYIIRRPIDW